MTASPAAAPRYAGVAGAVLGAPLVLDVRVASAARVKPEQAPDIPAGRARFYVEADVMALIRGASALPARVSYVTDVPLDARGKAPKLKKQRFVLFARPVSGHPEQIQLTSLDGQTAWTPELDALVRSITREVVAPDAPPAITGIGNVFHVAGTLPGEGETQIFLTTETNAPISLQIVRRPDQAPRWTVALGDIIDEGAGPPAHDTLLWYRLACGLPRQLPAEALADAGAEDARIAREDYALVLRDVGPCS